MATIYFLYRSKKDFAPLTVRLQIQDESNKVFQFQARTDIEVSKEYWEKTRHKKRNVNATDKSMIADINSKLSDLEDFLLRKFIEERPTPHQKFWLKKTINNYHNPPAEVLEFKNESVTFWIQHVVDTANTRENAKGGLGLSSSRIKSYKNLLSVFEEFQGQRNYNIKDIDKNFGQKFLQWLLTDQSYSEGYARKKIDDLKSVCVDAESNGIQVSPQLKKLRGGKTRNNDITYLTPLELEKIEKHPIKSKPLLNTRKWLLLGCNLGQRGNDLLSLTESNFVTNKNGLSIIKLTQQKTGRKVEIPVLATTKEILKEGLPYKIALQKFNNDLKELCKIAGLDTPTIGCKIAMINKDGKIIEKEDNGKYMEEGRRRKVYGTFPKHELITSHICRRTFATNRYGDLPTPLLMQITAHSTEKMFLSYIGKSATDYAQQLADYCENHSIN